MTPVRLYGFELSHPTVMARRMLELKGIEYREIEVPVGLHWAVIRLYGFRGATVPAMRLPDGTRVQTTRRIARALDRLVPEPRMVGDSAAWVDAETWSDEVFQNLPRRLLRSLAATDYDVRRWVVAQGPLPLPGLTARLSVPIATYLARDAGANEANVVADLRALRETMDHVDALLTDGTARVDPPDALALQLILTTRTLTRFSELEPLLRDRPSTALARGLDLPAPQALPVALPPAWTSAAGV